MNIPIRTASLVLFLSTIFISGSYAATQKSDLSLRDLAFKKQDLPACEIQEPPEGDDLPCAFDTVPYYSEDPDFLACGMNLMGMNLGLLEQNSAEVKALLLQAYLDPSQDHHEIGMYGVEFKTRQASEQFIKKIRPMMEAMAQESNNGPEVWHRGKIIALIWNDAEPDSPCFEAFTKKLQAAGLKNLLHSQ